jgi:hypothetical protein
VSARPARAEARRLVAVVDGPGGAAELGQLRQLGQLGGQPDWRGTVTWPLSRALGTPMCFLWRLEAGDGRTLLAFMTQDEQEYVDETWDPEAGENACFAVDGRRPGLVDYGTEVGPTCGEPVVLVDGGPAGDHWSFVGGAPRWLQSDETPPGEWEFVAQVDSAEMPHALNFGDAGVGYVFWQPATGEGRLLWQSL